MKTVITFNKFYKFDTEKSVRVNKTRFQQVMYVSCSDVRFSEKDPV